MALKAAAPKKETARIQVAPDAKRAMPQATIKMQQTQPLAQSPGPLLRPASSATTVETISESDPLVSILSWVVLAASLAAAAINYLAFSA